MAKTTINEIKYLSDEMIEQQAACDLLKYRALTKKALLFPIYPEEILETLWNIRIEYVPTIENSDGEHILACYYPSLKKVVISEGENKNPGRLSFSIAHEAGHVSLHQFALQEGKTKSRDCGDFLEIDNPDQIESQADKYAACLLMPREEIFSFLDAVGCDAKVAPVDMNAHAEGLKKHFRVSNEATEYRLTALGITVINGLYQVRRKKLSESMYMTEIKREKWSWGVRT